MRIEEIETYDELIEQRLVDPAHVPAPEISRCFVARDDHDRIVGYVFIQPILVVEPIWTAAGERGHGTAVKLFSAAVNALAEGTANEFTCHASSPEVASYLERLGMEETGQRVFKLDLVTAGVKGG